MYINGHCRTNLDDYNVSHVIQFASVPNISDLVYCTYKGNVTTLKVVSVAHDYRNKQPYIVVELNK